MVGLALEGGGAKGSYQAGSYMALKKCHVKIDAVVGTSIGSLNGALIAAGDEKLMLSLWEDASMNELLGIDDAKAMKIVREGINFDNIKWTFGELYRIFKNRGLDVSNYRALVRNNVNEKKVRNSRIKYGLTTLKVEGLNQMELFIDNIPNGKLHDYIVASSYMPVFKREKLVDDSYYLDGGFYNLSPVDMLLNIGCDKIYVVNIKGPGVRKRIPETESEIIEIKPNGSLGSVLLFDRDSIENNITYGYYDTLKVLKKIDGVNYYFNKKSKWFYERLNHRVDDKTYNVISTLLGTESKKSTVIKALEYVLEKEKQSDLIKYNVLDVIKYVKKSNSENIVYNYVKKLTIW